MLLFECEAASMPACPFVCIMCEFEASENNHVQPAAGGSTLCTEVADLKQSCTHECRPAVVLVRLASIP